MNSSQQGLDLDEALIQLLMTPEGRRNPVPRYSEVREGSSIFRSFMGMWVVARYDECRFVLRNERFGMGTVSLSGEQAQRFGLTESELERYPFLIQDPPSLLALNPPNHTRLRTLVAKAFTPLTVEALRPRIAAMADGMLEEIAEAREVDLLDALAFPLSVAIIGELVGVPEPDRAQFRGLVHAAAAPREFTATREQLEAANSASATMNQYFVGLVAARRRKPNNDFLSQLLAVKASGDMLSTGEIISTVMLIFAAGFDTMTHFIGNGLYALLSAPEQLERLRLHRSLMGSAVDEVLRLEGPVQLNARTVIADVEIGGRVLTEGEKVLSILGAGNRDPRRFSRPDTLDVGRSEGASLSFGGGIHFCLGAALARVEAQVVFQRLLDRFRDIELAAETPSWRDSLMVRGLETLPVRVAS